MKLTAVVLLTIVTEHIHYLERGVRRGDTRAAAMIEPMGKAAMLLALVALLFAVLAFH